MKWEYDYREELVQQQQNNKKVVALNWLKFQRKCIYFYQFDDLLMYVVPMLVIFFSLI